MTAAERARALQILELQDLARRRAAASLPAFLPADDSAVWREWLARRLARKRLEPAS